MYLCSPESLYSCLELMVLLYWCQSYTPQCLFLLEYTVVRLYEAE